MTKPRRTPTNRHVARIAPALASADLADLQRLTLREVQALTGRSATSLRRMVREGRFPAADHRDGPRCVRWSAGLVRRWLQATQAQGAA